MFKKIALVAAASAIAIPIAVTQTRSSSSLKDLLNEEHTGEDNGLVRIEQKSKPVSQAKSEEEEGRPVYRLKSVKEAASSFEEDGYAKKQDSEWVDFDKDRSIEVGKGTGLGCHRLLFQGKNYPVLKDPDTKAVHASHNSEKPLYLGKDGYTQFACSTATLKNNKGKKLYEFEFAFKRDGRGLIEKIFVEKERIYSQVVFYADTSMDGPYAHGVALQRHIKKDGTNFWKVANPATGTWIDLDLENGNFQEQPIYYVVWTEEGSKKENILQNLGIKSRSDSKWFSAIVPEEKTQNEGKQLEYFGGYSGNQIYYENSSLYVGYGHVGGVANILDKIRGSWKKVEDFCGGYKEEDTNRRLSYAEELRFKEYCFRSNKSAS